MTPPAASRTRVVRERPEPARSWCYLRFMDQRAFFEDLSNRVRELVRNSPAQDIEKNLRALLASAFERLDLVLREDFDVQKKLLERASARLAELEARVRDLEAKSGQK
jgi:BMFP domain-containing protein YqiC